MASRHRRHHRDRILIAGDGADVTAIQQVLAVLPDDAYGQVYIEVLDEREITELFAPPRITVNWLSRVRRASAVRPLAFAAHGEALAVAVAGWVGEWMPGEGEAEDTTTIMWIGAAESAHAAALYEALEARVSGLNALPDLSSYA